MRKRLFVAINLPDEIKDKIKEVVREIQPLFDGEIRFLKPDTWHITITFLGYQPEDATPAIIESIKLAIPNHSQILKNSRIVFERIVLGPIGKRPRMIWLIATNETSKNLILIKNKLEDELIKKGVRFEREKRGLGSAHITLARFQVGEAEIREGFSLPKIENISFTAESLDLMESHLKRTGAEYETLSKVDF